MSTPKETNDTKPNLTPKNYITTGIGKHLLTPCRRIGLSRKTPNSNALDIFKPKNDSTSTPTPKSSTSTQRDIICTPNNELNNLDDTPKPEPKSKGKSRISARTKIIAIDNDVEDLMDVAATTMDTPTPKTNEDLGRSSKECKPKKMNKKTQNNNNDEVPNADCQDEVFTNSNEPETDDKKIPISSKRVPKLKSRSLAENVVEELKPARKKCKTLDSSDSDSDDVPLKSLIVTDVQVHHPPVKRCINFNEKKSDEDLPSDASEGRARISKRKKLKLKKKSSNRASNKTKNQESKPRSIRIVLKKFFSTEDSEDEMFTSTPDDDKKQSENLLKLVAAVEKEVKQKEETLEKLKQAEVYRIKYCPEKLKQSIDLWFEGCRHGLKDLLVKVQEKGPKEMNMLLKDLKISDEIAAKLKVG